MKQNAKPLAKIIVPVLIVVVIAGMWVYKNTLENEEILQKIVITNEAETQIEADFSLEATHEIDFTALSEYGLPIIADYGSDSCIPCKEMTPVLQALNTELQGKAFIKFVDVRKYYEAVGSLPVQVIPTQVFFNADGTAYMPSQQLQEEIGGFQFKDGRTLHIGGLTETQMRTILKEMGVE